MFSKPANPDLEPGDIQTLSEDELETSEKIKEVVDNPDKIASTHEMHLQEVNQKVDKMNNQSLEQSDEKEDDEDDDEEGESFQ